MFTEVYLPSFNLSVYVGDENETRVRTSKPVYRFVPSFEKKIILKLTENESLSKKSFPGKVENHSDYLKT